MEHSTLAQQLQKLLPIATAPVPQTIGGSDGVAFLKHDFSQLNTVQKHATLGVPRTHTDGLVTDYIPIQIPVNSYWIPTMKN